MEPYTHSGSQAWHIPRSLGTFKRKAEAILISGMRMFQRTGAMIHIFMATGIPWLMGPAISKNCFDRPSRFCLHYPNSNKDHSRNPSHFSSWISYAQFSLSSTSYFFYHFFLSQYMLSSSAHFLFLFLCQPDIRAPLSLLLLNFFFF